VPTDEAWRWIERHEAPLVWLAAVSVLVSVVGLALLPWLIARLPADAFAEEGNARLPSLRRHPVAAALLIGIKNAAGGLFVIAGILMLVLPGQGVLSILLGLALMHFPGKRRLMRRIAWIGPIRKALGRIRARAGKEPFR